MEGVDIEGHRRDVDHLGAIEGDLHQPSLSGLGRTAANAVDLPRGAREKLPEHARGRRGGFDVRGR